MKCSFGGRFPAVPVVARHNYYTTCVKNNRPWGPMALPPTDGDAGPAADRVLRRLVERAEPARVMELATELDMHANTVRARLADLDEQGLVTSERAHHGGRGRPSHVYLPTPPGRAIVHSRGTAGREYRSLAGAFATHLAERSADPPGEAREVGRQWGWRLADGHDRLIGDGVVTMMQRLGFDPARDDHGVALRTCPLLDLAVELPQVVCQVHWGLVEGMLARYRGADIADAENAGPAEDSAVELLPFHESGACRLRYTS